MYCLIEITGLGIDHEEEKITLSQYTSVYIKKNKFEYLHKGKFT